MATKYHYGTGIASVFFGILGGVLIRKSQESRNIDAEARAQGYIKPEECPPPCPPFTEITDQGQCERCGGQWIPGTGPYNAGECIPRSGGGAGPVIPGPGPIAPGGGQGPVIAQGGGQSGGSTSTEQGTSPSGGLHPSVAKIPIG